MEAVRWYRLAAEQGNAFAQYSLGYMYRCSGGEPEDDVEAVCWYYVAGEQEHDIAQINRGWIYNGGYG